MPDFNLRMEFFGDVQLSRTFRGLMFLPNDLREPLQEIAEDFYKTQDAIFDAEGGAEDNPQWEALAPEYEKWKHKNYPGAKILELTGKLRASLTGPSADGSVFRLQRQSLEIGTDLQTRSGYTLGLLHHTGTARMPSRKPILLSHDQRDRFVRIFRDFLDQYIDRAVSQPVSR